MMRAKTFVTPGFDPRNSSFVSYFSDVPRANPAYIFVQMMRDLAITLGCGANTFCVDQPITRASAAVFTVKTFLTPYFAYAPK